MLAEWLPADKDHPAPELQTTPIRTSITICFGRTTRRITFCLAGCLARLALRRCGLFQ